MKKNLTGKSLLASLRDKLKNGVSKLQSFKAKQLIFEGNEIRPEAMAVIRNVCDLIEQAVEEILELPNSIGILMKKAGSKIRELNRQLRNKPVSDWRPQSKTRPRRDWRGHKRQRFSFAH